MNKFLFFTYPKGIINNYAIINCKFWLNLKKQIVNYDLINEYSKKYKIVFLEPEVMYLKKNISFRFDKWLNVYDLLANLPNNVFISIDYPCDMNPKETNRFIFKTIENIQKFGHSKQYITTIQFKFRDFHSFKENFELITNLPVNCKILAIGNLCRLIKLKKDIEFGKKIIDFLVENIDYNQFNQIHIYGLGMRLIPYFYNSFKHKNIILSIDSTKWTKAITKELKLKFGINCKKENRQIFFNEYIKHIYNKIEKRVD